MNKTAMTGRAASLRIFNHEGVFHRGSVAAQTVAVSDVPALLGQGNRRRIIPERFVVDVRKAGLGLIGKSCQCIGRGHVAFDARKGAVERALPLLVDIAHAVAACAEFRSSRVMIRSRHQAR